MSYPLKASISKSFSTVTCFRSAWWSVVVGVVGIVVAGCAGVDARIARHREAYATWPLAVQEKVAAGEIALGFTREQVQVALGEPDRVFHRTDVNGTAEIWSYRDRRPRVGFGIGIGFGSWGHRGGSVGTVGLGTGIGMREDEKLGVAFGPDGTVTAIEVRGK